MRSHYLSRLLFFISLFAICVWISQKKFIDSILIDKNHFDNSSICEVAFKTIKGPFEQCCELILRGDKSVLSTASKIHIEPSDDQILDRLNSCDRFFEHYPSYKKKLKKAPGAFSIAYSILAHRDFFHVEKLLRLIYQPQHIFCIHADKKSVGLESKIKKLIECFPNVFLASQSHVVVWGGSGILEATLRCLQDLSAYHAWTYFINLSAQDFPLKTNAELMEILSSWKNKSMIDISDAAAPHKVEYSYKIKYNRFGNADSVQKWAKKHRPPFNLTIMKGNLAVALWRPLATWFITSDKAEMLRNFLSDAANPDEYFWQTAIWNREKLDLDIKIANIMDEYYLRYSVWRGDKKELCNGKFIRDVCIFGASDVRRLINIKYLFANKLYFGYQTPAYECLSMRYLDIS